MQKIETLNSARLYTDLSEKYSHQNFNKIVDSSLTSTSIGAFLEQYTGPNKWIVWDREDWEQIEYGHRLIDTDEFLGFIFGDENYMSEKWYILLNNSFNSETVYKINGPDFKYFIDEYYPLHYTYDFIQREDYLIVNEKLNRFFVLYHTPNILN